MAFDIALVVNPGSGAIPAVLAKRIDALCKAEEIPPEGITIMGGNPYVNVTGLDNKIRRRAERENLVFAGCTVDPVAVPEGDRREFKATVTYFDKAGFLEALKSAPGASADQIRALQQAFTYTYSDIGSCSMKTAKMSTMQNADNIAMLASRRASNRAKRAATGVGLTSIDEVMGEPQGKDTTRRADFTVLPQPPAGQEGAGDTTPAEDPAAPATTSAGKPSSPPPSAGQVPAGELLGFRKLIKATAKRIGRMEADLIDELKNMAYSGKLHAADLTPSELEAAKVYMVKLQPAKQEEPF
jgi:hypothetical protein